MINNTNYGQKMKNPNKKKSCGQWVKMLDDAECKPHILRSVLRTHRKPEGENWLQKLSSDLYTHLICMPLYIHTTHARTHTHAWIRKFLRHLEKGWRDGSVVRSTDCSLRGSEFNSQQPHGGSQPSVMGSGASEDSYSVLMYINKYIFKKKKFRKENKL